MPILQFRVSRDPPSVMSPSGHFPRGVVGSSITPRSSIPKFDSATFGFARVVSRWCDVNTFRLEVPFISRPARKTSSSSWSFLSNFDYLVFATNRPYQRDIFHFDFRRI